jgi:hypothetical protein
MNLWIAVNADERIIRFDGHAGAGIARRKPAGNEIKAAPEEKRQQGQQLPEYPYPAHPVVVRHGNDF